MALNFQFTCLTLQNNCDDRPESPCLLRCLIPKESINFIIHVESTLTRLINAATNLSSPTQTAIDWELRSCMDSLLHMKTNVRILTCWHLHTHLSQHKYTGISPKKKDTLFSPTLIGFFLFVCFPFLFNDYFGVFCFCFLR